MTFIKGNCSLGLAVVGHRPCGFSVVLPPPWNYASLAAIGVPCDEPLLGTPQAAVNTRVGPLVAGQALRCGCGPLWGSGWLCLPGPGSAVLGQAGQGVWQCPRQAEGVGGSTSCSGPFAPRLLLTPAEEPRVSSFPGQGACGLPPSLASLLQASPSSEFPGTETGEAGDWRH